MNVNVKCDGCQQGLASLVYEFFDKKTSGVAVKIEIIWNQGLVEELLKPTVKSWKTESTLIFYIDNIWDADLANV